MLEPKLTQRRLNIDDRDVLTADEVAERPEGTLAVVLDRRSGQDASDFRYRLLKLVMEQQHSAPCPGAECCCSTAG